METWSDIDVSEVADRLDLPTLILHARGDLRSPFEQALELGTLIKGSRVVPLDSSNHLMRADEPAWTPPPVGDRCLPRRRRRLTDSSRLRAAAGRPIPVPGGVSPGAQGAPRDLTIGSQSATLLRPSSGSTIAVPYCTGYAT